MGFASCLILLTSLASAILADVDAYVKDDAFDRGWYGVYPVRTYVSTNVTSPRPNILRASTECDGSLYAMISPRGLAVDEPSAMILDASGYLVWRQGGFNQVYNLMVQEYRGKPYLTFWGGDDAVRGHGSGFYYMLDSSYNLVYKVAAAGPFAGDLHEFRITKDGTAMLTVYDVVPSAEDFRGRSKGYLWDCLLQEIDIETGELLFQWRATDHYKVSDSERYLFGGLAGDGSKRAPFDYFHMNSIDKDKKGNYLVSARFTCSVTYINGTTGEIIWILGGKRNMFTDLSGGKALSFGFQHDARWHDNYTTISIFDNGGDGEQSDANTRGILLKMDFEKMTVELLAEYINPEKVLSMSQGSLQILDNGNVFMGYGNSAAYTEYAPNGTALCDVHFGAKSSFGSPDIQSYRAYKFAWHGFPTTPPNIAISHQNDMVAVYVSWNGATEVRKWVIQGVDERHAAEDAWFPVAEAEKVGFETEFINLTYPRYLRVLGLDSRGEVLGKSGKISVEPEKVTGFSRSSLEFSDEI
ncbi:hypothetical protein BP5796_03558 [Coleophoma crateriformis]|uniref:ASST-domain-containing protein n=1 Tax=Coleophoma crateriformis TaxID=565419 RepID=A0A3D8SNU8_9HELO|nr:hypothetical protein BP5796_03558 [Coleophoma crateriformis]